MGVPAEGSPRCQIRCDVMESPKPVSYLRGILSADMIFKPIDDVGGGTYWQIGIPKTACKFHPDPKTGERCLSVGDASFIEPTELIAVLDKQKQKPHRAVAWLSAEDMERFGLEPRPDDEWEGHVNIYLKDGNSMSKTQIKNLSRDVKNAAIAKGLLIFDLKRDDKGLATGYATIVRV